MRWNDVSQFQVYWESSLIMMLSRIGILTTCLILGNWMALTSVHSRAAQVAQTPSSLYTQHAVTEVQVTQQASEISRLRTEQEAQNATITSLRDDLSTVKGMGMGAVSVIGILQALQIILQIRGKKVA